MRKIGLLFVCLLSCVAVWAQSLEIKKEFTKEPYSSVLVKFANEFREHEMPDMAPGERFPYAAICVNLEGDGGEVAAAKRTLSVEMGMAKVQERVTDKDNMLLFLVSSSAARVSLTCGDGCSKVRILDLPCLESNAVYSGTVHFVPYQEKNVTQAPQRQFFKFRVTPDNAVVTIVENGTQEILPMREGGIASKMLNYGTYTYSIAADKYHTKEGTFTVSATQAEMKVDLLPQFGWLTVAGDNTSQGGYVFATNAATGGMIQLGTIPLNNKEMSSGVYTLRIQKEKYKDYSTTITIEDGKTTTLQPVLEANFAQVTLTTHEGADIYLDGSRLGTTRWTGTLELGDHSVEARQASHHTAYTNVRITAQSAGQTITLNNPLPIYGSLIVDGSPADVAVYVDGKKVGTSPLLVSELLIGEHTVRLEKEGYAKQEKTVQIAEGQEHMMDYTLAKETPKAAPKAAPVSAAKLLPSECFLEEKDVLIPTDVSGECLSMVQAYNQQVLLMYEQYKQILVGYTQNASSWSSAMAECKRNEIIEMRKRIFLFRESVFAELRECSNSEEHKHMQDYTLAKETPKAAPQAIATSASTGGHEYVDLGLSVKWATCNVGANKPEDYGDYFAWGETKPKSTYDWSTYKWCRGSYDTQTKYNHKRGYGTVDKKRTLELADDAARANWGGSWRMPTKAEQDELREKCTWIWTTQNGVAGYKVTSKSNGNSIFLPAAGYRYGSWLYNVGSYGYYWSSSLGTDRPDYAYELYIYSDDVSLNDYRRYSGCSVRPVCP